MDSVAIKDEALRILGMDLNEGDLITQEGGKSYTFFRYLRNAVSNSGRHFSLAMEVYELKAEGRIVKFLINPKRLDRMYERVPRAIKQS